MTQDQKEWIYRWGSIFLGGVLFILYLVVPKPNEVLKEALLAAALVFLLSAIERLWLWETIKKQLQAAASEALKPQLDKAKEEVSNLVQGMNVKHEGWVKSLAGDVNELIRAAHGCELKAIYIDRLVSASQGGKGSKLHTEILKKVEEARETVWLLGIAFSEGIQFPELVNLLKKKKMAELDTLSKNPNAKKLDIRILLLDPLRSTAVFRALLESPLEDVARIVGAETDAGPNLEALFSTTLHRHVSEAAGALASIPNAVLEPFVKFYGHNPMCWLVIVDDEAYYEPYTFGLPANVPDTSRCLGPYMPVFRFGSGNVFQILKDHFDKIWLTSDVGYVHYNARLHDRETLGQNIFDQRIAWLRRVYDALSWRRLNKDQVDRRYPRFVCDSKAPTTLRVIWKGNDGTIIDNDLSANVLNSSRIGICLGIKKLDFHAPSTRPEVGDRFEIKQQSSQLPNSKTEKTLLKEFIDSDLEVKWSKPVGSAPDFWSIGLRKERRRNSRVLSGSPEQFVVTAWRDRQGYLVEKGLLGSIDDWSAAGIRITLKGLPSERGPIREERFMIEKKNGQTTSNNTDSSLAVFWDADLEVRWSKEVNAELSTWTLGLSRRIA